jgi:hypothetical protein
MTIAQKSLNRLSELADRPEVEKKLVRHVCILDTAGYAEEQERNLVVRPTAVLGVVELWFEDGAGYDGLIGTLTLCVTKG